MQEITLIVQNSLGLHARAAMKLCDLAARYQCRIIITHQDRKRDAKDIMAVMGIGAKQGIQLDFNFEGIDEAEALLAIEALFNDHFGEMDLLV